jgi:hypothetical protein
MDCLLLRLRTRSETPCRMRCAALLASQNGSVRTRSSGTRSLPVEPSLPGRSPLFLGVCMVSEAQAPGPFSSGRMRSDRSVLYCLFENQPRRWSQASCPVRGPCGVRFRVPGSESCIIRNRFKDCRPTARNVRATCCPAESSARPRALPPRQDRISRGEPYARFL